MPKKYRIHLSYEERLELQAIVKRGKAAARKRLRAQMLLAANESQPNGAMVNTGIAHALGVSLRLH